MKKFVLPIDFNPTLRKDYTEGGVHFEIWVENKGLQKEAPGRAPHLLWLFAIWIKGRMVETGPFRWDPSERELTDLAVCNNLATFYGQSPQVQNPAEPTELEQLIENCRSYMFKTFYVRDGQEPLFDYDIHTAEINETGWEVTLSMASRPQMMYQFSKFKDRPPQVSCYVKAHVFAIDQNDF